MMRPHAPATIAALVAMIVVTAAAPADDFPRFLVPGEEEAMKLLDEFHAFHHVVIAVTQLLNFH